MNYIFWLILFIGFSSTGQIKRTSHYSVKATINIEQQSLNAVINISYLPSKLNNTDSIEFIVHEKAFIKNCTADNLLDYVETKKGNKAKSVVLRFDNKIKETVNISFEYVFILKKEDAPWGIDKISENWIELSLNSGWLPIISSYDNQFSSETELNIISEKSFDILSSGSTQKLGKNQFRITNLTPQIDLVLIGSSNFHESIKGNITIYENQRNKERNEFIFNLSEKSYRWLNDNFGDVKKIPPVKLVITPREESGYARKNFIVLSNDISIKDTLHFANYIAHEFAHFWSNGTNPLTEHRWLDESIAEYISWKFINEEYSKTAFTAFLAKAKKEASTIPAVYIQGKNKIPSHAVMYRKGVYKLFKLEQMIGEKAMFSLFSDWFKVKKKDSEKFLEYIENSAGTQVAQKFRMELAK